MMLTRKRTQNTYPVVRMKNLYCCLAFTASFFSGNFVFLSLSPNFSSRFCFSFFAFHVLKFFHIIHKFLSRCFPISEVCIPFFFSLPFDAFLLTLLIFSLAVFNPFSLRSAVGLWDFKKITQQSSFLFYFSLIFAVHEARDKKFATRPN